VVARPLLVSARSDVIDDLVRLAAVAGVELDVVPDLAAARTGWRSAPLVLLDDDVVGADAGLPRREDVVLIGNDIDDASVWQRAVRVGADHVVFLPDAEAWLAERFADAREGRRALAPVLAVVGGRGGAGATTLAAALAATAVGMGHAAMLIDLDPLGGGIDLAFGLEDADGLRWPDLAQARGRLHAPSLRDALPSSGELPILAWDRGSDVEVPLDAARSVLDAAVRVSDLVVVDIPRSGGLASAHAVNRAEQLFLVVTADVRSVAAADRVLRVHRPLAREVRAVVRGPATGGLTAQAMASILDLELAGSLESDPRTAAALDRGALVAGRGRGPLVDLSRELVARVVGAGPNLVGATG
jgi:secretion/DNA translocation related CpaE-like protein